MAIRILNRYRRQPLVMTLTGFGLGLFFWILTTGLMMGRISKLAGKLLGSDKKTRNALAQVLSGYLPICAGCTKKSGTLVKSPRFTNLCLS